jgi:DNA-binding beta-propeller fold protein YncE
MGLGSGDGSSGDATFVSQVIDQIGPLKSPSRIALSDSRRLYVSDSAAGIVAVYDTAGVRVGTLKGLTRPLGVALLGVETTVEITTETCLPSPRSQRKIARLRRQISRLRARLVRTPNDKLRDRLERRIESILPKLAALSASPGNARKISRLQTQISRLEARIARARNDRFRDRMDSRIDSLLRKIAALSADTECTQTTILKKVPVTRAYIGDESDGSVRIFENDQLIGALGRGSGEFSKPNGIAVSFDRVYVVDSGTHQLSVYDGMGTYLGSFGFPGPGNGELDFPTDVVIHESDAEVYVADFLNQRIAVFDLGGNWVRNIPPPPNDQGDPVFYRPVGLGLDPNGNLYVVDNALSCVVVMDRSGALLDVFGYQNGSYWTGELDIPIDAVSDGMRLYVTSSKHRRVNVFEVSP